MSCIAVAGSRCEQSACSNRSCLNGGSCLNSECICDAGFTGYDCSSIINATTATVPTTEFPTTMDTSSEQSGKIGSTCFSAGKN
jgi:hypothetical protein